MFYWNIIEVTKGEATFSCEKSLCHLMQICQPRKFASCERFVSLWVTKTWSQIIPTPAMIKNGGQINQCCLCALRKVDTVVGLVTVTAFLAVISENLQVSQTTLMTISSCINSWNTRPNFSLSLVWTHTNKRAPCYCWWALGLYRCMLHQHAFDFVLIVFKTKTERS